MQARTIIAAAVAALLLAAGAAQTYAQSWEIESVANFCWENSIALDPAGQPHIVYIGNGGSLHYAACTGSGWHDYTVNGGETHTPRLAVAPDGTVHIAYAIRQNPLTGIWHASFDGAAWDKERVGDETGPLTLTLDPSGEPQIRTDVDCMVFDAQGTQHWVRRNWLGEANWEIRYGVSGEAEVVAVSNLSLPRELRLAVDATGLAHLTYQQADVLYYVFGHDASWSKEMVSSVGSGAYTGLAVDEAGTPHVSFEYCSGPSYPGDSPKELRYGVRSDGEWYMETIDTAEASCGLFTDLVLDSLGRAHISYDFYTGIWGINPELRYAVYVPEPATLALLALGGLVVMKRRRAGK